MKSSRQMPTVTNINQYSLSAELLAGTGMSIGDGCHASFVRSVYHVVLILLMSKLRLRKVK